MQHGLDFLVAASQVACRVGVLHVIVVTDAACQDCQQIVAQSIVADALGELDEPL